MGLVVPEEATRTDIWGLAQSELKKSMFIFFGKNNRSNCLLYCIMANMEVLREIG